MTAAPSPPCGQFDALLEALRQTVGATAVRIPTSEDPLDAHQVDWRKRYRGQALAIVCPANAQEVAEVVRLCGRHRVSIVPQGGNTSLVGGSVPDDSGQQIVLNLQRLNRVLDVDAANLSMTVQAGCLLADVQGAADAAGLLFPLSLASEGSCTIGGNLATNAGGTQVLRYGTARELCLGLEAVTAQGEIWDGLKSLRKDNTGYDLRDLLIGSEGTLAIITAATLRLYPRPTRHQAALVGCDSLAQCVSLLQHTRTRLDARLTGFEVMHQATLALALRHLPEQAQAARALLTPADSELPTWTVLLDTCDTGPSSTLTQDLEALLDDAHQQGLLSRAVLSHTDAQYRAMWTLRESIPMAEKMEGHMVKHDIAVPTSRVPTFVAQAEAALQQAVPGCRIVCFGHLGDGNLHYNVQAPADMATETFLAQHESRIHALVYDLALSLGGTMSAEHGIGQLKRTELGQRQSATRTAWMRAIKQALDPENRLNPGRMVP